MKIKHIKAYALRLNNNNNNNNQIEAIGGSKGEQLFRDLFLIVFACFVTWIVRVMHTCFDY